MFNIIMAAADAKVQPNIFMELLPMIGIGFVLYFLLIRPQGQQMKAHKARLAEVTRGDKIVTGGGLIGKVVKVTDDELTVDLGEIKVKVRKSMIADIMNTNVAANDTAKKKPVKANKKKK